MGYLSLDAKLAALCSHCISGSSPDEPFPKASFLPIQMKTESNSSLWRYVAQSWFQIAHVDLPVASPLLSTGSNSWISQRPDLKIFWHLPCLLFLWTTCTLPARKICSTWLWCESFIFSAAPLSLLVESANGLVLNLKIFPARKMPMLDPLLPRRILMLFSEPTQDSMCVWSFEPPLVIKDVMLWCYLPCQLYHLRYGNTEDQSYKGIVTLDGVSENSEVDQLISNRGAQVVSLGVSVGFGSEFKMLIKQPLFSDTTTSLSTVVFHSPEIKLVSVSP